MAHQLATTIVHRQEGYRHSQIFCQCFAPQMPHEPRKEPYQHHTNWPNGSLGTINRDIIDVDIYTFNQRSPLGPRGFLSANNNKPRHISDPNWFK